MNVGRIVHEFNDYTRKELFNNNETRTIIVSIFYPSEINTQVNETNYLKLFEPCEDMALSTLKEMGVDSDYLRSLKTQVYNNAKPDHTLNNYPVILYAPGFGVVRDMYTYHIQQLVECGFIVVSIGATYDSIFTIFPDGRFVKQAEVKSKDNSTDSQIWGELLKTRVEDILYVMNHLEEIQAVLPPMSIDTTTIGIVGHSLGGAAAFEVAKKDARIRACVMLDASFQLLELGENVNINTPILIMRQEKCTYDELRNELSEEKIYPYVNGFERLFTLLSGYKSVVKVQGANHMTFCDVPVYYKEEGIDEIHYVISKFATNFLRTFILNKKVDYKRSLDSKIWSKIVEIDEKGSPVS